MSTIENGNKQEMEADPPGLPLTDKQAMASEQIRRFQRDIEEQCQRVALSLNPIAEAFEKGTDLSAETVNHTKAQILRLHLHLEDLKQWLDAIG